jgi:hypothetical protein
VFNHVTVDPRGTVIVAGLKAKFWMVTVGVSGAWVCIAVGDVLVGGVDGGLLLVHPAIIMNMVTATTRIAQCRCFPVDGILKITPASPLNGGIYKNLPEEKTKVIITTLLVAAVLNSGIDVCFKG